MKKNHILYYVQMALYNFIYSVAGGAMFQTFMLECGVSEARASLCASVFQVVQMATMMLLSRVLERIKKVLVGIALYMASYVLIFGAMLFLCLSGGISADVNFTVLLIFGLLFAMSHGCYSIIAYKQPYHIMEIKDYGKVSGQGGAIAGIFGIIVTSLITVALEKYEYFSAMTAVLLGCVIFALVAAAVNFMFTPMDAGMKEAEKKKINIFKYKPFYLLMLPNFARGVSTGVINLIVVIGYYDNTLDSASAALLVTVTQAATLVGCQAYSIIARKRDSGFLCLIFSIGLVIFMPLMALGNTSVTFIAFYGAVVLANTYISYAVPVIVANHIPYSCLGQYTAWRMGLMTLGISVGSLLVPVLLDAAGTMLTLLVGGIAMLPCGIGYFLFERAEKSKDTEI